MVRDVPITVSRYARLDHASLPGPAAVYRRPWSRRTAIVLHDLAGAECSGADPLRDRRSSCAIRGPADEQGRSVGRDRDRFARSDQATSTAKLADQVRYTLWRDCPVPVKRPAPPNWRPSPLRLAAASDWHRQIGDQVHYAAAGLAKQRSGRTPRSLRDYSGTEPRSGRTVPARAGTGDRERTGHPCPGHGVSAMRPWPVSARL
jgi:hypothetical protein